MMGRTVPKWSVKKELAVIVLRYLNCVILVKRNWNGIGALSFVCQITIPSWYLSKGLLSCGTGAGGDGPAASAAGFSGSVAFAMSVGSIVVSTTANVLGG